MALQTNACFLKSKPYYANDTDFPVCHGLHICSHLPCQITSLWNSGSPGMSSPVVLRAALQMWIWMHINVWVIGRTAIPALNTHVWTNMHSKKIRLNLMMGWWICPFWTGKILLKGLLLWSHPVSMGLPLKRTQNYNWYKKLRQEYSYVNIVSIIWLKIQCK